MKAVRRGRAPGKQITDINHSIFGEASVESGMV
jgi:hypothetical protein